MSQTADRKEVLDDLADSLVADAQDRAAALALHDRGVEGAAKRAKEREIAALQAADEFTESCLVIVAGLDLLCRGLVAQDAAAAKLARWPGSMQVVSQRSRQRRFGDYLARRLFDVVRVNSLGRVVLNSGGSGQARDFVGAEHALLRSLFARRDNGFDTESDGGNGVAPAAE